MTSPFRVALTFDAEHPDRPHRVGVTSRILSTLATTDVRASFFLQGRWVESNRELARDIALAGHVVGNHSFYHARMPLLSPAGLVADVRAAERAIVRYAGVDPRPWFRCPFGAGTHDPAVLAALDRLGYRETRWDVDAVDWRRGRSGRSMVRETLAAAVAHGDGAVVLLHAWTTSVDDGLSSLIAGLRDAGATLVGIDELAGHGTRAA